jgi:MFS family permease
MKAAPTSAGWHMKAVLHSLSAFAGRFSRGYWAFFFAAFCMDLGFGLFVFLFNLYLADLHFDERFIGHVFACFTLGNVAGTIPAMFVTRRYGLRPLLLFTSGVVPVLSVLRLFFLSVPTQFSLAFFTGAALCGWPICFSPSLAQLTGDENRAAGFSAAFATGIGLGTLAGIAGGYIPELLHTSPLHLSIVGGIRLVLLMACVAVALGLWPLGSLSLKRCSSSENGRAENERLRVFHPYLLRFLPAFALWNVVTGSFPLFGALYLQKELGFPLGKLGAVFGASQLMQFIAVLGAPLLFKRTGIAGGVSLAQLATAALLLSVAGTRYLPATICFYVLYFGAQFMCGPGIYQMLMEQIPEAERSSASAFQNLSGALFQAGAAATTGACIVAYGYRALLAADAAAAVLASVLFACLGLHARKIVQANRAPESAEVSFRLEAKDSEWTLQKATK